MGHLTTTLASLTANETNAIMTLVDSCLANMGGSVPSNLAEDTFTWCDVADLQRAGWSKHEAAGTYGALVTKLLIHLDEEGDFLNILDTEFVELDAPFADWKAGRKK